MILVTKEYRMAGNGKNFRGFVAICYSFLREIWEHDIFGGTREQFGKVFFCKSFLQKSLAIW